MDFRKWLNSQPTGRVILDGAMGTMLQSMGMAPGTEPVTLNFTHPDWIVDIHARYIQAGSQILCANTFGANRYKLNGSGYSVQQVIARALSLAKQARGERDVLIALDMGPIGQLLEPSGSLTFEQAYDMFKEQVVCAVEHGADLIMLETMTDLAEIKAALLAVKENSNLPVICSMTFEQNRRTFTGCSLSAMALTLEGLGADAIGINCSIGPEELLPMVEELLSWTTLPVAVKPNAGLPDPVTNAYSLTADEFADYMVPLAKAGARLLGGCCGTTPAFIASMVDKLRDLPPSCERRQSVPAAVCSATRTVDLSRPRIIGERINPTGKKRFKQALKEGNMDYILGQAIEQVQAGAEILDVNVGLPDIDEKAVMVRTVKALQSVTDLPLQIDSTVPEVLEAALRVYVGKPIVNSVNGEEKSLAAILPLVKKYGAAVVGLTLDENGIPKTAEQRLAIARRILDRALALGIKKENVYIDCLTLTASAEQQAVGETLRAIRLVKEQLGLKTVLGVSNISFGLPNRELINHTFLAMALASGLDLAIINPNVESMTGVMRAYQVLANYDNNAADYIAIYGQAAAPVKTTAPSAPAALTLEQAIVGGLRQEAVTLTRQQLEQAETMAVIQEVLVPILDKVGKQFEQGKLFLPQLMLAAEVAGACFEVVKQNLRAAQSTPVSKGTIVLATVKGDIHDIGKNIVKTLLENYGYTVIDLGKDVPEQTVVDTVLRERARLVGLSALMTTTLPAMERTIALLRQAGVDCQVMVGGAVLTPEYARRIGADYYAKDATEGVSIAKKVFG